jgi:flotillin
MQEPSVSQSFSNVESIRILDNGSGGGINSLPNTVTNTMANLQESLGQMTGFDLEGFLQNISIAKTTNDEEGDTEKSGLQQIRVNDSIKQLEDENTNQ